MGLEEHLLAMFREDFEFHDEAGQAIMADMRRSPSEPNRSRRRPGRGCSRRAYFRKDEGSGWPRHETGSDVMVWLADAERELKKIPFFVRGKAAATPRNTPPSAVFPRSASTPFTKRRPILRGDGDHIPGYRVVIVTLDSHAAGPAARVSERLAGEFPGLSVSVHASAEWAENPEALEEARWPCVTAISSSRICLFIEEHITAILPDLQARRDHCDAMIGVISA
jgi:hypothetical protein